MVPVPKTTRNNAMKIDVSKAVSPFNFRNDSINSAQRKGIGFHTSRICNADIEEPKLMKSTFKKT
jgi:hypothetical protein